MDNNIGPKRLVVGAHYGLRDWLAQRVKMYTTEPQAAAAAT